MNMNVLYTLFFAFLLNETNIKASSIPLAIVVSEILLFQDQGKEDKNIGIELARKAKSSGDHKLAAYTYLNLINKFPDQISILTEYTSFISNQEKITVQELDELSNLLMISVFKVQVGEVKKVLDLAQQIGVQKEKLSVKLDVPKDDETKDFEIESEKLLKQVEIFPSDETKLKKLLDGLNENREVLNPNSAKLKFIEKAANDCSELYQAIQKIKFIEICLAKLNSEKKSNRLNSDFCVSLIQAAEATLPTLFGLTIEDERLPTEIKTKINELPTQCKLLVNEISKVRSLVVFEQIKHLVIEGKVINFLDKNSEGFAVYSKWQDAALAVEKVLKKIQSKFVEINSLEVVEKASLEIRELQEKLNEFRRKQHQEYQRYAIKLLKEAFKEYNDYTWSNPNSEKAYSILTGNSLQFIDLGLLSPDVSRCYNDIVSRLLGRLNPAKLPEWYSVCVNAKKFKLEDF